jgi:uncharacterized protein (TIGR00375 family)
MKFVADLHVHSKYSRATARNLDLENIHVAAQLKGIDVVGTGDFCHPAWFSEIKTRLEPSEPGLFRLKAAYSAARNADVPPMCRREVRFILETEISLIYKKDGRTRKNHNLVFVPDLDAAERLNRKLEAIGNIRSDGRPILGLDARDLLEIVLETAADAFVIPAHIWTPWFSMLGSKSGFDTIEECFGDLAPYVFAAETGLSSDPAMNWRVSALDRVTLVSNSDAHSPSNLGREANLFETGLSYFEMREALNARRSPHFSGTLEFYPQEGKYHLDGHRSCGTRLSPGETQEHGGKCPVCAKPVTIGVLHRVEELADRPEGAMPEGAAPYYSLIPLGDILAEVLQVGAKSQKVAQAYWKALAALGPELELLLNAEVDRIERLGLPLLGEAVERMRAKRVTISAGYDGTYGTIKIFSARERRDLLGQRPLFSAAMPAGAAAGAGRGTSAAPQASVRGLERERLNAAQAAFPAGVHLNAEQRRAVEHPAGPLVIVAGPGTGKTLTLTRRIAHMIASDITPASAVLALTFTQKAAEEMRLRLRGILGVRTELPWVATFHGLCWSLLREWSPAAPAVIDDDQQRALISEAAEQAGAQGHAVALSIPQLQTRIMRAKQRLLDPDALGRQDVSPEAKTVCAVYRTYCQLLESERLLDYEDLIFAVVMRLETDAACRDACRLRFRFLGVDEYQDVNHGQYRLIRILAPPSSEQTNICVIGDPDQSIYGFRGSDSAYFRQFSQDYPHAGVVRLTRNYRSAETVLNASFQVINRDGAERCRTYSGIEGVKTIRVLELGSQASEARAIARNIEQLVGGTGFHSIDTGRVAVADGPNAVGYADIAVFARTNERLRVIAEALGSSGVPFQLASRRKISARSGVSELLSVLRMINSTASLADFKRAIAVCGLDPGRKALAAFTAWCRKKHLASAAALSEVARFPVEDLNRNQQLKLVAFAEHIAALRAETEAMSVREAIAFICAQPGVAALLAGEEGQTTLERLIDLAQGVAGGMAGFLALVALHADTDHYHPREQKAALMSMHASKGLEFPVVFIAGCEDGLVPYRRPGAEASDLAEERRLFYVAMTRAKDRLYLTHCRRRRIYGKTEDLAPSPFLKDIEGHLLENEAPAGRRTKRKPDQLTLF